MNQVCSCSTTEPYPWLLSYHSSKFLTQGSRQSLRSKPPSDLPSEVTRQHFPSIDDNQALCVRWPAVAMLSTWERGQHQERLALAQSFRGFTTWNCFGSVVSASWMGVCARRGASSRDIMGPPISCYNRTLSHEATLYKDFTISQWHHRLET